MKVYESSHQTKRDYSRKGIPTEKKVPQIKIKNSMLENSGFQIGKEFTVIYQPGKITLILIQNKS